MLLVIVTVAAFAIVMLAMAVGVMVSGKCLRGSCGGPDIVNAQGESVLCATCPNRTD